LSVIEDEGSLTLPNFHLPLVYNQSTITLRFLGGDDPDGGTFMNIEELPLFDVGNEDILYVQDNGVAGCPLVGCAEGRIRIVNGELQDERGFEIISDADVSNTRKGKRKPSATVDDHLIGIMKVHRVESQDPTGNTASTLKTGEKKPSAQDFKVKTKKYKIRGKKQENLNADAEFSLIPSISAASATISLPSPSGTAEPDAPITDPVELSELQQREAETINNNASDPITVIDQPTEALPAGL
jgi:hypothetical protein